MLSGKTREKSKTCHSGFGIFRTASSLNVYKFILFECELRGVFLIEVFVRSHDKYIDIDFHREMSYHWQCGLDKWAMDGLVEQFKGRILSDDNMGALEQVLELAKETNQEVKVYDLSRIADRVRAMKRGVMRTPTLIMGEKRYQGFEEISKATARKLSP
jgi:hypothetical protein